jgi:hypothetical protein
VGLLRRPALEDHHRSDRVLGADVGDVEPLDPDRQLLHAERFLKRAQRLDPPLATVLAPQPVLVERQARVALGKLAQAALVAALGGPHLDRAAATLAERLADHTLASLQVGADDHRPRNCRAGAVVLAEELLGDLRQLALALVLEVEALPLGEDAVADLEHLGVGVGPLDRDPDQVGGADRPARDLLALEERADRLQPVAVDRRPLEILGGGGLLHLLLLVTLDLAVATGEEVDDRVDVAPVLVSVHVADTGRPAALDEVVEAGVAGVPARLRPLAGPVLEELAEQVERRPHPLGAGEGPEVGAPRAVALTGEVDTRVLLVEADRDVRIRLVVAQADVEHRAVALDEALLGEQRLCLAGRHQELDPLDLAGQPALTAREVGGDPLADRGRLADVEHAAAGVVEDVDAGSVGQRPALGGDSLLPREGLSVAVLGS